jgi:hypothetical protein
LAKEKALRAHKLKISLGTLASDKAEVRAMTPASAFGLITLDLATQITMMPMAIH